MCLVDILAPSGLDTAKIFKKLSAHFFHEADLLYQIFAADDTYLRDMIGATCKISGQDLGKIELAVVSYYNNHLLAPIKANIAQQRFK